MQASIKTSAAISKVKRRLKRRGTQSLNELEVVVIKALGIPALDIDGTSDPYCKLIFGQERFGKTKTIKSSLNPVWNEKFTLSIPSQKHVGPLDFITVEVWDKDSMSADEFIGSTRIFLPRTHNSHRKSFYTLVRPKLGWRTNAKIQISVRWKNFFAIGELASHNLQALRTLVPPNVAANKSLYLEASAFTFPSPEEVVVFSLEECHILRYPTFQGSLFITDYRLLFVPYVSIFENDSWGAGTLPLSVSFSEITTVSVNKSQHLALLILCRNGRRVGISRKAQHQSNVLEPYFRIFQAMSEEIQWRCEEGCAAFSMCSPKQVRERWATAASRAGGVPLETTAQEVEISSETKFATASEADDEVMLIGQSHSARRNSIQTSTSRVVSAISRSKISKFAAGEYVAKEYKRILNNCMSTLAKERWTSTTQNSNFELCSTYSQHLFVPSSYDQSMLKLAASQRSKCRLPVLTWLHPRHGAPLCRCSQPRSGLMMAKMPEDDKLLLDIRAAAITEMNQSPRLHIFDARPRINANANAFAGKGFENISRLGGKNIAMLHFLGIANIHTMRESLKSFIYACEIDASSCQKLENDAERDSLMNASTSFVSKVALSGWLDHLSRLLRSSCHISKILDAGEPCVVHCSDGWDRTSQLCALAQLLLDPHYRTISGFACLVEKDWCGFGHMFSTRGGLTFERDETSPIFMQFLDVVHQMVCQLPDAFEFDDELLKFLATKALYTGYFGTFLSNCERERAEAGIAVDTVSVWEYVDANLNAFKNPLYDKSAFPGNIENRLNSSLSSILIWRDVYRHNSSDNSSRHSSLLRSKLKTLMKALSDSGSDLAGFEQSSSADDAILEIAYRDAVSKRRKENLDENRLSRFRGFSMFEAVKIPEPAPLRYTQSGHQIQPTWPLAPGSTFDVSVKKVVIFTDINGKRYGAFLVRVGQTSPKSASCAFHRRYSDFSWLQNRFSDFGLQVIHSLPGKTFMRWLGRNHLDERRRKLDLWVMQLSAYAANIPSVAPLIYAFLNPEYAPGADWETLCSHQAF